MYDTGWNGVMKFRDNTMVCVGTTERTLIYGVVNLNYGIRLKQSSN